MRTLILPPGIGDCLWVYMKLTNTSERFHIVMSDGLPQRGHQLAELLPDLIASHEYRPNLPYNKINEKNAAQSAKEYMKWSKITQDTFYLSANAHLEAGLRIEKFLPDLPTSFKLEYATTQEHKDKAAKLLPAGPKYIGIYTSAYSNARNWSGWNAQQWFELIKLLSPNGYTFVIIGADYDFGVTGELMAAMDDHEIPYVNTIGQLLPVVVEILKRCGYFIGFPSGLSILNETLGKDGCMFYPKHLQPMVNTWAAPDRILNHNYKGCLFPDPLGLFDWLKNVYKIYDKI